MLAIASCAFLAWVAWRDGRVDSARFTAALDRLLKSSPNSRDSAAGPGTGKVAEADEPQRAAKRDKTLPAPPAFRKCLQDGKVVYTDSECPEGSREAAADHGAMTVIPARQPAPKAQTQARTVRDLALEPGEQTINEKQIEAGSR